jgi:hypothetical protein
MTSAQSDLALQIAQAAAMLGDQTYNWAVQNYADTSSMTADTVNNYYKMSQQGAQLAGENLSDYNNIYRPEMQQFANEAADYSSDARVRANMGRDESTVMQAQQKSLDNTRKNLQSYGIDPSSGMYGELEQASNTAAGAAAAGAGNQARYTTENIGRDLLGKSIQIGEQLPGDTVNALNSAYQGIAGAENSTLANAQTGANLLDASNPFLSTAMQLKYPPVGTNSTSQSTSSSSGESSSLGIPTGGINQPKSGSGGSGSPETFGTYGSATGAGGQVPGTSPIQSNLPSTGAIGSDPTMTGGSTFDATGGQYSFDQPYNGAYYDPYSAYMPSDNLSSFVDTSANAMPGGGTDLTYGGAFGGNGSTFGGVSTGFYASGGPAGGGAIPAEASPSGGRQVDDVPAKLNGGGDLRLNAGEFVVPRDVAAWKGHEFFQKLIDQSRKARMAGSAHPQQKPPLPSQRMGR